MLEHKTEESFKHLLCTKILNNYPINLEYVTNAHTVFEPVLEQDRAEIDLILTQRDFYELPTFVSLTADVIFVNVIEFLTNLSRKLDFSLLNTHQPARLYN